MLRATIALLEDFEEELGAERLGNTDELRAIGIEFKKRMETIAKLLDLLERHGWKWTTGTRDIIIYKEITRKEAEKEFTTLHIPEGIISFD